MEKTCRECNKLLQILEFYKNKTMRDGYLNVCKSCVKVNVANRRENNIEKIREYDRQRYRSNNKRKAQLNNLRLNLPVEHRRANYTLSNAIRDKKINRPVACACCRKECVPEGHHEDYTKPLEVIWLCRSCHCRLHRAEKLGAMVTKNEILAKSLHSSS